MFRHKDRMLNECRLAKKKNTNKEGKEIRVNEKDLYQFELKAIQQQLIKEGIRVHVNDLRTCRHMSLNELTDDEKKMPVGNTTIEVLLEKFNNNTTDSYGFGNNVVVGKTHDMTRWSDNKEKTKIRKNNRNDKMNSLTNEY